jgi:hypothetical protein
VVVFGAGTPAAAERARWRLGLPPACFLQADDPGASIEFVIDAGAPAACFAELDAEGAAGTGVRMG